MKRKILGKYGKIMPEMCVDLRITFINRLWLQARIGATMAYWTLRHSSTCTVSTPVVFWKAPKDNVIDRLKSGLEGVALDPRCIGFGGRRGGGGEGGVQIRSPPPQNWRATASGRRPLFCKLMPFSRQGSTLSGGVSGVFEENPVSWFSLAFSCFPYLSIFLLYFSILMFVLFHIGFHISTVFF